MLSIVQLIIHRIDCEGSQREQLLALSGLRGGLESDAPANKYDVSLATMIDRRRSSAAERMRTVRHLHELIAALDRRLPQVQRAGEASIAQAAAALRSEALRRIQELEVEARAAAGPGGLRR